MINAFHSGVAGSKSCQKRLDVSANNIANMSSTGFKEQQTNFCDLIYSDLMKETDTDVAITIGNGTKVSAITSNLAQGNIDITGNEYDFAILGEGYFCVRGKDSKIYYTRNGNFHLSEIDGSINLLTSKGDYVLNRDLSPVTIPDNFNEVQSEDGESGNSIEIDLAIFTFKNPYALTRDGYGRLSANDISGQGEDYDGAQVIQGALEGSNVDMVREMSNMMQAQRGFQFNAKLIQTADELENIANNLR